MSLALKSRWAALTRIFRSKGFGIQSPWAYSLDRDVINEHHPYYFYSDFRAMHPHIGHDARKLCLLFFRLANYVRPVAVLDAAVTDGACEECFIAGCASTHYIKVGSQLPPASEAPVIYVCRAADIGSVIVECMLSQAKPGSLLIVVGIHADKRCRQLWQKLCADGRTGVSFDLYLCGLVFFDLKMTKNHYVINF